jgi:hypothetical protein
LEGRESFVEVAVIDIGASMNPYVKSLQTKDDYRLLLTFENGEKRLFGLKPYPNKGVFAKLKDVTMFNSARVASGSVKWRGEIVLSYDTLYLESVAVQLQKSVRTEKRTILSAKMKNDTQVRGGAN